MENITVCICPVTLIIVEEIHSNPFHMFAEESLFAEAISLDDETDHACGLDLGHSESFSAENFEDLLRTNFFDSHNYDLSTRLH